MIKTILAIIAAALVAIPTLYAWRVSRDKKKSEAAHEKHKQAVRKAITEGDIDKVRREMARWL